MIGAIEPPPQLRMHEQFDEDGALRLALGGELDLAVIDAFHDRLLALKRDGCRVRLDLARLEFIDSTGLHELISASTDAKRDGWDLEIDPNLSSSVKRVIELTGVHGHLWPETG